MSTHRAEPAVPVKDGMVYNADQARTVAV